jgi:pyruvate, water dikinase
MTTENKSEWRVIIDLIRYTNPGLYNRLGRKMMNYLYKRNIKEIEELMKKMESSLTDYQFNTNFNENQPLPRINQLFLERLVEDIFEISDKYLSDGTITKMMHLWLKYEQSRFLAMAAEKRDVSLSEISEAIHRFLKMPQALKSLSPEESMGIKVALIRRFFSDDLKYINVTKRFTTVADFSGILTRTIGPAKGNGKLGGKAAGLFRAEKILMAAKKDYISLRNLAVPKTWYITSDGIIDFLHFNALEEMPSIKYRDPLEIRQEYPYLEQIVKNSSITPELISGLSMALDDLGDEKPLVVRSSSLLEDMHGSSFAGKYKSLFVSNQGTKRERLEELIDAILEIYASVFGPDPIEYRRERGLLDFNEEMGVMIQEVIGKKVGKYFFPSYAGVAFSYNEFRWSPRIKREDGIVRLVAGLGTRAVDRTSEDYPVLISPGQANLKVNASIEETLRYSQKVIDVINLDSKRFESINFEKLVQDVGQDYPALTQIASVFQDGYLFSSVGNLFNLTDGQPIITFSKLIEKGPFIPQIKDLLRVLSTELGWPVDIEFACDGDVHKIYLLQCRPQSIIDDHLQMELPSNIEEKDILFTANRFVNSAIVKGIKYIVYVDPEKYNAVESYEELVKIGKVIGQLNNRLPKQAFILVGPGRWGSRGDIKLGVRVNYSDINNTAMLIEVARKKGNYVPDVSFGTHFFQDLVEASIRYLPLYPDEEGNIFNETFLNDSSNVLKKILPDVKDMDEVIKVISLSKLDEKLSLSVFMDGEKEKAIAFFSTEI